jgi:epoxide hydrolase 4
MMQFNACRFGFLMAFFAGLGASMTVNASDWMDQVEHRYADSDGVKLHYAVAGSGPLIVFIHGFPDFWYSWHHQMSGLADQYRVAAMDTRGYNLSDKPEGVENYDMSLLVADVAAVLRAEQAEKAVIVGHDWGGAIAWAFAATHPKMTERLVIVNLPHMACLARELMKEDSQQHRKSAYARLFQREGSHLGLSPAMLAGMVASDNPDLNQKYREAFERSSLEAMMNYYRRNYPREPYQMPQLPKIEVPVLQFHGLDDSALLAPALNQTWDYLAKDWTLVTLPGVGHWSHHQAPDMVTDTIRWWLKVAR